jgi:hypothetical protein
MTPGFRKLVFTAHIASSIGWAGAVAAFLALALAGLTHGDAPIVHVAYPAMELTAWFVIVPLALASLLSGVIQALGTRWGLFRHYCVLVKFVSTILATAVLLAKMPLIGYAARRAAETALPSADFRLVGMQLAVHAACGLLVLLALTTVSVYKPWGLTAYGQRKQLERG